MEENVMNNAKLKTKTINKNEMVRVCGGGNFSYDDVKEHIGCKISPSETEAFIGKKIIININKCYYVGTVLESYDANFFFRRATIRKIVLSIQETRVKFIGETEIYLYF